MLDLDSGAMEPVNDPVGHMVYELFYPLIELDWRYVHRGP
jgi:hypothetical protein